MNSKEQILDDLIPDEQVKLGHIKTAYDWQTKQQDIMKRARKLQEIIAQLRDVANNLDTELAMGDSDAEQDKRLLEDIDSLAYEMEETIKGLIG